MVADCEILYESFLCQLVIDSVQCPGIENKQVRYNIYTVKRSSRNQRYKRQCCSLILAESDSLPRAHAQTTKTYYKHQELRIKKAQVLKRKTSVNSDIKDPSSKTKLQGRLLKELSR
ncbi:hypothetical protein Tco_0120675 [Tanacetum coccineum]